MRQKTVDISLELALAKGPLGQRLNEETRECLRAVVANPCEKTWEEAHGIGLGGITLWQAVVKIDPTFPRSGPAVDLEGHQLRGWERVPDRRTLIAALKYATH